MSRIAAVRRLLTDHGLDGLLLTHLPHIRWAVGFSGSHALLYISSSQATLLTDARYTAQATEQAHDAKVLIGNGTLIEELRPRAAKARRIGVDADHMTIGFKDDIQEQLEAELVAVDALLNEEMLVKSSTERVLMHQAQTISDMAFGEVMEIIKPGMTEQEVAAELVYRQLQHGADGIPEGFWPIVATGARSALPHASASGAKLRRGDMVLMDFGCTVGGYCSDMSRTVALGNPGKLARDTYQLVHEALEATLAATRAGVHGAALDATARDIIRQAGYEIPHSVGHSLGLEIHEWPSLRYDVPIPAGAIITIEPGVYVPGQFGIRIEDMVVVEPDGITNLTRSPKELLIL